MDDVLLTRRIFSQASRVVVWLGYSKYSEVALAQMENLLVHARKYVEHLSELGPAIGDPDSFSWRGLKEFFGHPWFGRIWSIPEVASANNVHLRWGGTYLAWDYMKSVMKLLDNPQMLHLMIGAGENLRNVARLIASRDKICGGEIASLADHLFTCSTFQASHPKDRILISQSLSNGETDLNLVDGKLSAQRIYQNTARHLLLQGHLGGILPLSGMNRSADFKDSPSWVPDWSTADTNALYSLLKETTYSASKTTLATIRTQNSTKFLTIAGNLVSKITSLTPVFSFNTTTHPDQANSDWEAAAASIAQTSSRDPYRPNEPLSEALWRTFIGDRSRAEPPTPASYEKYYQIHVECTRYGFPAVFRTDLQDRLTALGLRCSPAQFQGLWTQVSKTKAPTKDPRARLWGSWSPMRAAESEAPHVAEAEDGYELVGAAPRGPVSAGRGMLHARHGRRDLGRWGRGGGVCDLLSGERI